MISKRPPHNDNENNKNNSSSNRNCNDDDKKKHPSKDDDDDDAVVSFPGRRKKFLAKRSSSVSSSSLSLSSSRRPPHRITMAGMIYDANRCLKRALDPNTTGLHPGLFDRGLLGIGFYTVWEAGLIFSGNVGTGIVMARNPVNGSWSYPAAVGLSGIGWGLMGGASRKTIVYLIYDYFTLQSMSGEHGAMLKTQIESSLGTWGRSAEASAIVSAKGRGTNIALSFSRGIFGGISIEGALCKGRNRVNERFYGRPLSTADILFSGEDITIPEENEAMTLLPEVYDKLKRLCEGTSIYQPPVEERIRVKSTRKAVDREGEEALKEETIEYVDVPQECLEQQHEESISPEVSSNSSISNSSNLIVEQNKKSDNDDHQDGDEKIEYEVVVVDNPMTPEVPSEETIDKMRAEAEAKAS